MRISDWSSDVCSSDLRQRERRGLDLEHIALARLDPLAERQGRGAEEMDMHVAGAAEQAIFEMMVLEVGDAVRHIRFARQKGLFPQRRSEEHTSELQSLMRISYAVFCLKKKKKTSCKQNNNTIRKQEPNRSRQDMN